jgi:two-component system sensor histidine kinase/response regulator
MVVDDQNDNLRFVGEILDRAGYGVMPALSGSAALARAAVRAPDLALLDMAMPGIDGVETCRRLRQLPGLEELPVLFVTAAHDRGSLTRAFAAGAVDYITKPFFVDELLARVRNHLELKQARERLQTMLREREEITDIVAHDLKNPLTSILFTSQPRGGSVSASDCGARLGEIRESADEALRYIQRFLSHGAGTQRLRRFTIGPLPLADVVREAVRLQSTAAEHRGLDLVVEGEAEALGDPQALRNVIQNLVSNAIRHSPEGSTVTVQVCRRGDLARCDVMDRGAGVHGAIRERLFERFVHHPGTSGGAGYSSGLGLAIARHDLGQMGGRLWYEDRSGGGAVFAFELPTPAGPSGFANGAGT